MITKSGDKKAPLLTDETFNNLRLAQRHIQEATDFSPSLRLLINDVIDRESIDKAAERLINKIKESVFFEEQKVSDSDNMQWLIR